jgi:hypothetical protein
VPPFAPYTPRVGLAVFVGASIVWPAACLDSPPLSSDGGEAGSDSQSEAGAGDDGRADVRNEGEASGVNAEAAALGLLVDDMTAPMGTQIALPPPDGGSAGSYSTYSDFPNSNSLGMKSDIAGTAQLSDSPVSPPIVNPDGSQIAGELCLGRNRTDPGTVVNYAGLNLNFAYGVSGAGGADASSSALPIDVSRYGGVSFYIRVNPLDAGAAPSMRFGLPDTQTADPEAWPSTSCAVQAALEAGDSSGLSADSGAPTNPCDDDFGADLGVTPGAWTKVELHWGDLAQEGWGAQFSALQTDQLIGMKWQVNGAGLDAAIESFYFCISDIYFIP